MTPKNRETVVPLLEITVHYEAPGDPIAEGLDAAIANARNVLGESPLVSELAQLAELHRKREEFRRHRVNQLYGHITDEELTRLGSGPLVLQMAEFWRLLLHRIVRGGL